MKSEKLRLRFKRYFDGKVMSGYVAIHLKQPPLFTSVKSLKNIHTNFDSRRQLDAVWRLGNLLAFCCVESSYFIGKVNNGFCHFHCLKLFAFSQIRQPKPTMNQVGPRSLLEFGGVDHGLLASWLIWRKWIFDVDSVVPFRPRCRRWPHTQWWCRPWLVPPPGASPSTRGVASPSARPVPPCRSSCRRLGCGFCIFAASFRTIPFLTGAMIAHRLGAWRHHSGLD